MYSYDCPPSQNIFDPLLLRTHYTPLDSQVQPLQSQIESAESELSVLDQDIEHLNSTLRQLLHKQITIQHDLDSLKSIFAPIRRLPPELLCEIFQIRCTEGFNALDLHSDSLWTIIQVCALWRTTAFSTPTLWSTLLINLSHLKGIQCNYTRFLTRFDICLAHSRDLPISFAFTGTHYQDSAYLIPLITKLCSSAHRWDKVYFCPYTTNVLANWLPSFRQISTPHLTALGLTSFNPSPGFVQAPTRFTSTPSLSRLALYDYRTLPHIDPTHLPTFSTQITALYLDSCPYYAYTDILPYLPNLQHLEILNKYQHSARAPANIIHLPNLRIFKATGWLGNLCLLLPHLDIPDIHRLDIIALEEQCQPCTCATAKKQIVNDWLDGLNLSKACITFNHTPTLDLKMSTDDGILRFLLA